MSDDAFAVDPRVLHELGRTLIVLSARLDEARATTLQVDAAGFGQRKLSDATQHFVQHWAWQAERLGNTLQDTGNRLGQAASQYQQVEDAQIRAEGGATTA
ncbi:MAG: hypothetical protein ACXVXP_02115 [Mycobacteriaceae bacterium]